VTHLGYFVIGCRLMRGILHALLELCDEEVVALGVGHVDLLLTRTQHLLRLDTQNTHTKLKVSSGEDDQSLIEVEG